MAAALFVFGLLGLICYYGRYRWGVSQNRFALCEGTNCKEIGAELCFDFALLKTDILLFVSLFTAPTNVGYRRLRRCLKLCLGRCPKTPLRALPRDPGRRFALHPTSVAPLDPRFRCASFWFECGFCALLVFPSNRRYLC